jgi:serine/threonine protein kinase
MVHNKPTQYPVDALPIGTQLNEYLILSVLGRGSFGITYLANDTNLDRQVAIKEYLPIDFAVRSQSSAVNPRTEDHHDLFQYGLASFLNEARTLVKFKHRNIVQVLSYFEHNKTAYFVMEYEVGKNLKQYLSLHPNLSEKELLAIFMPVNDGLDIVQQHGFIHRDIKPDNIYIRDDNSPVLLDFGAARDVVKTKSEQLTRILTQGYAPYEQDNPSWKKQGPWTDIYSLGATLYFAVTGNKPISASHRAGVLMSNRNDPYISVYHYAKDKFSPSFLDAIDTALAFEPEKRPQSLKEWSQILTLGLTDAAFVLPGHSSLSTRIVQSNINGKTDLANQTFSNEATQNSGVLAKKNHHMAISNRYAVVITVLSAVLLGITGLVYTVFKAQAPTSGIDIVNAKGLSNELVNTTMILSKTACWHYARSEQFQSLIDEIKQLPPDSDRAQFIAGQTRKLNESVKGFESNFSQYSVAVIKLRGYPVKDITEGVNQFTQLPDYRNNQTYKKLGKTIIKHATGEKINIEGWKNDLISFTQNNKVLN